MASALLARRNEPLLAETKVYMRKPHPTSYKPGPAPNPNPNPNFGDRRHHFHPPDYDDPPPATVAVSDNSSSFDRKLPALAPRGGYISFNISDYSRRELREIRLRLVAELEQVRAVAARIESSARSAAHANPNPNFKKPFGGARPVVSPKGVKRLAAAPESEKLLAGMMGKCKQILTKLMKQKNSKWFNTPVDVVGMKLHDYNQIIKHPMDLGTVKSNLGKGLYRTPLVFAEDVRLTFQNALLYNPQGHAVNVFAGQLLRVFESEFRPAYQKYESQQAAAVREEEERQSWNASAWSRLPPPNNAAKPEIAPPIPTPRPAMVPAISPPSPIPVSASPPIHQQHQNQHQHQHHQQHQNQNQHQHQHHHHHHQQQQHHQQQSQKPIAGKPVMGRMSKPKAKDLNKRPMSFEEKGKLSEGLQSLPQEKMDQVLQIVKRRNNELVQDGDEIELDFEAMHTETLWELDRFVSNCKKMMSKMKRQEAMASNPGGVPLPPAPDGDMSPLRGDVFDSVAGKRIKKGGDHGEEDVDIGEELPSANYPSVEIEKDNAGSSSSSDSDSSSSSDSDSDSSSGSDSDDDDGRRSPAAGLRPSPRN